MRVDSITSFITARLVLDSEGNYFLWLRFLSRFRTRSRATLNSISCFCGAGANCRFDGADLVVSQFGELRSLSLGESPPVLQNHSHQKGSTAIRHIHDLRCPSHRLVEH